MYKPSMNDIKDLRARTGAGLKDCKNALKETEGDIEASIDWLRKRGIAKAAKKAGRVAAEGVIHAQLSNDKGVLIEVNCETDFVGKTQDFKDFVGNLTDVILTQNPSDLTDLLENGKWSDGQSVQAAQQQLVLKTGENVQIRRFESYTATAGSHLYSYIHTGARLGVMIEVQAPAGDGLEDMMENIAMHIVATRPEHVSSKDIDQSVIDKEFDIQMERAAQDESLNNKPEKILQGIIRGRVSKWCKEISLLEQEWYEDKVKVSSVLKGYGETLGGQFSVNRFVTFSLGEGIAKKENNFADEVASMTGQN